MKKITKKLGTLLLSAMVFGGTATMLFPERVEIAQAGVSNKTLVNNTTLFSKDEINKLDFIIGNGIEAVSVGNTNAVRFTPLMDTSDVLLLSAFPETTELESGPTVIANATFTLTQLQGDKQFGVMFGIARLDSMPKYEESAWLYFENNEQNNGFVYGLNTYSETGEETVLIEKTALADGVDITVSIEQFYDKDLSICVDGGETKNFENITIGHIGFGQDGAYTDSQNFIDVTLTSFEVRNRFDVSPENTNLVIDGSLGEINEEECYVRGSVIFNEDGSFSFYDAGHTTVLVTRYQYSNFQIDFDIVDMQRTPEFASDGTLLRTASQYFALAFGLDTDTPQNIKSYQDAVSYKDSCWTQFTGDVYENPAVPSSKTRISYGDFSNRKGGYLPENYQLWNPHFDGRTANLRISVIDGIYTFQIKWEDEEEFYTAFMVDLGYMPVGHIVFSGGSVNQAAMMTNVTIDNFKITNMDREPNLIEVGYKGSALDNPGDYEWTDTRNPSYILDYEFSDNTKKEDFPVVQTVVLGVCVLAAIGFIIGIVLKENK